LCRGGLELSQVRLDLPSEEHRTCVEHDGVAETERLAGVMRRLSQVGGGRGHV
jgi:hypothetical protein